jgi:WD40 repeat protein
VYRLFRRELKPYELEVEGCVTALSFHAVEPNLLVGATFNGQMFLWDLNNPDPLVGASVIDEYFHSEAVNSLLWPATGTENPMLLSLGSDGKVLHWHQSLQYPLRGLLVRSKGTVEGGCSMSCFPEDTSSLVVGSETGRVFKVNIPAPKSGKLPAGGMKWKADAEFILNNAVSAHRQQLKATTERYCQDTGRREVEASSIFSSKPELSILYSNSVSFAYEQHDGKVTGVTCSPFQRNLFATASLDGTARIYSLLQAKALFVLQPQLKARLTAISWSLSRPALLAVGASNSNVYLYDFSKSKAQWHSCLEGDSRASVTHLAFSKSQRDFLGVAYSSGEVRVFQLAHSLSTLQAEDARVLRDLVDISTKASEEGSS